MLLTALVLNLRKDASGGNTDASPALSAHGVSVEEDGQQHTEDLRVVVTVVHTRESKFEMV